MQIRIQNELDLACTGFDNFRDCFASLNQIDAHGGPPGGFHLRIGDKYLPSHTHDFYFS